MIYSPDPIVGKWYWHREWNRLLEVINVDDDDQLIDIHDEIGNVIEMESMEWRNAPITLAQAPRELIFADAIDDEADSTEADPIDCELFGTAVIESTADESPARAA